MSHNRAPLYPLLFAYIQILTKLESSAANIASSAKRPMLSSTGSNQTFLCTLPLLKCLSPFIFYYAYLHTFFQIVRQISKRARLVLQSCLTHNRNSSNLLAM